MSIKVTSSFILAACLVVCLAICGGEARPKRSIYYAAAPLAIQTVPVVHQTETVSHEVRNNPVSVVKTEQVNSADHSSYSYSTEVKNNPVHHTTRTVHQHTAAAAVAAAPVAHVASVSHVAPVAHVATVTHHVAAAPAIAYYSPYHYVIGK